MTMASGLKPSLRPVRRKARNSARAGTRAVRRGRPRMTAANGHTWDSGTVTLSPTCQRTGTMTYECTSCGGTKTETILQTSHDYSIYRSWIDPTCTSSGRTSGYECRWCSATTCSTLPALGHSLRRLFGDGTAVMYGREGKETAKCSRCSATQTRTVSALGHEEVTDEGGTPATCLQTGRSAGQSLQSVRYYAGRTDDHPRTRA